VGYIVGIYRGTMDEIEVLNQVYRTDTNYHPVTLDYLKGKQRQFETR
jgi:hypothetical protein